MAYANNNGEIIVDKFVTSANGTKDGSVEQTTEELSSIKFSTRESGATTTVTDLSMVGDPVNGSLYIAYMVDIAGTDITQIRRIDISGGKTGLIHDGKFDFNEAYDTDFTSTADGVVTKLALGADLTQGINGATSNLEITVTNVASPAMTIAFTNSAGITSTLTGGTDFCTVACATANATATSIADAIDTTDFTKKGFQGLTATAVGSVVTLEGVSNNDHLQVDIGATALGDIMINQTTNQWQLPFIHSDLVGANKHKIAIYQGALGVNLRDSAGVSSGTATGALASVEQAQEITNDIL